MSRLYLQWHITERCGNDCRHCYAKGHRITDDTKQDDFLLFLMMLLVLLKDGISSFTLF